MLFSEKRFFVAALAPVVIVVIIVSRLFYLQVIQGQTYLERSESNFIQERPISHSRGMIFDQTGVPLVDNRPAHDLYITYALLPDTLRTLKKMMPSTKLVLADVKTLAKKIETLAKANDSTPLKIASLRSEQACQQVDNFVEAEQIHGVHISELEDNDENACHVTVIPSQFPSMDAAFRQLQELIGLTSEELTQYVALAKKKAMGLGQFKPVLFVSDIGFDAYARIEAAVSLGALPGVAMFDSIKRRYIHGKLAAHALGYLNELSPEEIKKNKSDYRPGQRVGRRGIEAVYERDLRGEDGAERYVVDAKGRRFGHAWESELLGGNRIDPPIPGHGLVLALDYDLQKAAEEAFAGQAGSVVALEVGTGFVLALASFPAYDPNEIIARDNRKIMQALTKDSLKPWINKAIQEHYAPGSTFKAITAIAGFEHNMLNPHARPYCSGLYRLGRATWRCFKREGHGPTDLVDALKTSCDVYFYNLGHLMGADRLASSSRLMGFGRRTGIDLDTEIPGLIPDTAFYKKRYGYNAPGFVVNTAIGQGDVTVTPIQLAVAYDAIVNGGTIYQPQMVREVIAPSGELVEKKAPRAIAHLKENENDLRLVKEGLAYVMEPGGTAYGVKYRYDLPELSKWLRESGVKIGGKTGTAQVVRLSKLIKHLEPGEVEYLKRDHAWFVGFAPADNPEIVVVAMTEHGGFGGSTSAPVVAEVIKIWNEKVRGRGRYMHLGVSHVEGR
jgi:penicillin-binding protein 2